MAVGSMLHRRARRVGIVATIAALVAVAAGCGDDGGSSGSATAGGDSGKTISIGIQTPFSLTPTYVGIDQGIFKKHGISDVKFVTFTDIPAMSAALTQGQVDLIFQSPIMAATVNEASSSKLKFVAPGLLTNFGWVASPKSGVPAGDWRASVRAFEGKTIGVTAMGGIVDLFQQAMAREVGLDPRTDFTTVAVGTGSAAAAALKAGAADVVSGDASTAVLAVQETGGEVVVDFLTDNSPPQFRRTLVAGYLVDVRRADDDPRLFAAFAAGYEEANAFVQDPANRAAVEATLEERLQVDAKTAGELWTRRESFDIDLEASTIDRSMKLYVELGLVKSPVPTRSDLVLDLPAS